ncbi:MAG TPA: lysozyme inhibitor LprI family protein [Sphingorhabdus sp.]|nr:lysozyme inhibitor LprI family protein [Sphingorhabdus sp.]
MNRTGNIGMKWAVAWSVIAFTMVLFSPNSAAQGQSHDSANGSATFSRCMKASGGVTSAMKACLSAEYTRLDRELNVTYKSVMKALKTPHLRTRLVESQRVWIWRRDFDCKLRVENSGAKGGTAGDIIYDDCRVEKVRDRIKWLKLVPRNPSYLAKV